MDSNPAQAGRLCYTVNKSYIKQTREKSAGQSINGPSLTALAAGPLDDFIDGYGDEALDLVTQSCDEDMRLQFALSGVWLLPDSHMYLAADTPASLEFPES